MDGCYTEYECHKIYEGLNPNKRNKAVAFLSEFISESNKSAILEEMELDPDGWISKYHFGWGMEIRNKLRDNDFDEIYFEVHNLDDIYVYLIEDAVLKGKYVGKDRRDHTPHLEKMRRLHLERDQDISGVSGLGVVAYGVQFQDGTVVLRWDTLVSSTTIYNSVEDLIAISGHGGATRVVFDD